MTAPRSYGQNCSLARAMDLLGERWTVLIVRELARGPKRFGDLAHSLTGIGTTMLAARLKRLEAADVIERPASGVAGYRLTARGERLVSALGDLLLWGFQLPDMYRPDQQTRAVWLAMTMHAALDRAGSAAPAGTYAFHVGEEHFWLHIADSHTALRDGTPPYPADATLTITLPNFYGLATGSELGDLDAVADGDHDRLAQLLQLFKIPAPLNPAPTAPTPTTVNKQNSRHSPRTR